MNLRRFTIFAIVILAGITRSFATWSIIIIDQKTKQIGIAGASCTYNVYGIGSIVPGKGAIIVQAMSNSQARQKGVQMIIDGASPEAIIKAIRSPRFDPEHQQYAVICINYPDAVTYTGTGTSANKGTLTAKGISVQGNTLTDSIELEAVLDAALEGQRQSLPIEEILMQALEAGAKAGGDNRCGEFKASSAFLTIANATDNPEKPSINLVVKKRKENVNAVEILRMEFEKWKLDR